MKVVQSVDKSSPQIAIAGNDAMATPTLLLETITLDVSGMKCAGCVKAVENQLSQYPGVVSACVNLLTEVAVCQVQPNAVDAAALAEKLTETGFPTQPRNSQTRDFVSLAEKNRREIQSSIWQLITAGVLIFLSGIGHFTQHASIFGYHPSLLTSFWFHWGLATATLLGPGRSILVDGFQGFRRLSPNMNSLVGFGALTAYIASVVALVFPQLGWECFFDEPVMLLGFILLGRTLEKQAKGKAQTAYQALLSLQPPQARLVADPSLAASAQSGVEIPADLVRVGEFLQVLPGEKIPVDGEIIQGQTTVDESMLTGEAIPISKQTEDLVYAGTLNQLGAIVIRATRTGQDTTLAQIVALVETAQTRKAPVQRVADTVAGYFTYGVMAVATLTFMFWYFIGTRLWPDVTMLSGNHAMIHSALTTVHSSLLLSLKLAIAVLVVACPCALGLATPTAILVGTGIGAERGLLIKGGDVLEKVSQIDTIVFDKTGTLTTGKPTVTNCIPALEIENGEWRSQVLPGNEGNEGNREDLTHYPLLQLAAAAEMGTNHPLASAIQAAAEGKGLSIPNASDFITKPGLGVRAVVEGEVVLVGTEEWLKQAGVSVGESLKQQTEILAKSGKTIVYVAYQAVCLGAIAIADTLRPDAITAIENLRRLGLRVMMLTGDRLESALPVATTLSIEPNNVLAGVLPEGKAAAIAQLQNLGHQVAMIGDGINDAPALAQADVGIAWGARCNDIAIESAQIVLMRDVVMDIVESIQLSRATFNKIRQNLFWALAYNTLGIPIAAGVLLPNLGFVLSPAAAGAMMAFSSVSVVTNSLLLRRLTRRS